MIALVDMLQTCTHRDLELIARAHKLPFTRREPKAIGLKKLMQMLQNNSYQEAFNHLTSAHIDALQALIIGGGWLPLPLFTAHFGEIRRYRPWRISNYLENQRHNARHPWRYPLSVAERLYHLGYIVIKDGEMVGIIDEVRAMLPPLPQLQPEKDIIPRVQTENTRLTLLRDTAALLGILLKLDAKPLHERWLSLSVIREVNACLQHPDDLTLIRSELQTGRIRWLHYLAQVSGLLNTQGGNLKPTADAWNWLAAPPQFQWDYLMQSVEDDLASRNRLWDQFRFPEVSAQTWRVMRHTLDALSTRKTYRVKAVMDLLKPHLLPDKLYDIGYLLRDVFAWSGVLSLLHGRLFIHHQAFTRPTPPHSQAELAFPLPQSASPAFVILLSFAQVENSIAIINQLAINQAIKQGLTVADIVKTLYDLSGKWLSTDAQNQIQMWAQSSNTLTLKPMIILSASDAKTIQQVRTDWRLAGHFSERISPHHLAVIAEDAHHLIHRLKRRHIDVTSFLPPQTARSITQTLNHDMAAYLLLAVRTYQKLQQRLDGTIHIPKALTHWLTAQVHDPASIEASAERLTETVKKHIPVTLPYENLQDEKTIQQWVTFAYQRQKPLTIDYFAPSGDGKTTRTISIDEIYEANSYTYIDAYCHDAETVLTFRLDRILCIHEPTIAQEVAV